MLRSLRYYLIIPILFIGVDAVAQDTNLWDNWTTEEIADGVNWKSYHGENYFDSKQSINIIEVICRVRIWSSASPITIRC